MYRIIIFIAFNVALIVAQVFITSKDTGNKGLIIPVFNVVLGIAIALFSAPYSITVVRDIGGVEVSDTAVNAGGFIDSFFGILILMLIPAIINFILYFIGRHKFRLQKRNEINRMKIDDLA